jgi:ribonucleotide monophosphatase NagD (HAD superfamily)
VVPLIAGKPHPPMVEYVRRHVLGTTSGTAVMVGDQPGTDGHLAERLGVPFVLVDSGVTPPGAAVDGCPVALLAADFVSVVAALPPV